MINMPTSYVPSAIDGKFFGKHIITVNQFERSDLDELFSTVSLIKRYIKQDEVNEILRGRVMATMFYEPSTRTDLSFQAAMVRMGGEVIGASNGVQFSSVYKGENLADSIRAVGCYADVIVFRHPEVGSASIAAESLDQLATKIKRRPILINAGDGIGEHPTQALLDLFTIIDEKKSLDDLHITMVGDLKHGRTVHSLCKLICYYGGRNITIHFISPRDLEPPRDIIDLMESNNIKLYGDVLDYAIPHSDIVYWTRIQEERFDDPEKYQKIKNHYIMNPEWLGRMKHDAILMHPLPRKHEMGTIDDHRILDNDPRSIYFKQMENGMYVRMALLYKALKW